MLTVPVSRVNYCVYDGVVDCRGFSNNGWHRFGIRRQSVSSAIKKENSLHYSYVINIKPLQPVLFNRFCFEVS